MSNKTQLQTNNTTLDDYIARINAAKETAASLPEAGSGGGGSGVETCTVIIDCSEMTTPYVTQGVQVRYSAYLNNTIVWVDTTEKVMNGETVTLNNIVCNTLICTYAPADSGVAENDGAISCGTYVNTINGYDEFYLLKEANKTYRLKFLTA